MRLVPFLLAMIFISGCVTTQKGGTAVTKIPQAIPPAAVEIALAQPENPEGSSTVEYQETTTTTAPDGTKVESTKTTRTEVGGSQDIVAQIKAAGSAAGWNKLVLAAGLASAAYFAFRRGWPFVAGGFALGAFLTFQLGVWAGIGAVAIAGLIYLLYHFKPAP